MVKVTYKYASECLNAMHWRQNLASRCKKETREQQADTDLPSGLVTPAAQRDGCD